MGLFYSTIFCWTYPSSRIILDSFKVNDKSVPKLFFLKRKRKKRKDWKVQWKLEAESNSNSEGQSHCDSEHNSKNSQCFWKQTRREFDGNMKWNKVRGGSCCKNHALKRNDLTWESCTWWVTWTFWTAWPHTGIFPFHIFFVVWYKVASLSNSVLGALTDVSNWNQCLFTVQKASSERVQRWLWRLHEWQMALAVPVMDPAWINYSPVVLIKVRRCANQSFIYHLLLS